LNSTELAYKLEEARRDLVNQGVGDFHVEATSDAKGNLQYKATFSTTTDKETASSHIASSSDLIIVQANETSAATTLLLSLLPIIAIF